MSTTELLEVYERRVNNFSLCLVDEIDVLRRLISLLTGYEATTVKEYVKAKIKLIRYKCRLRELKKII